MNLYVSRLLLVACVLAGVKFVVRGPMRSGSNSGDFRAIYLPSRAWTHGLDPYNYSVMIQQWHEAGGSIEEISLALHLAFDLPAHGAAADESICQIALAVRMESVVRCESGRTRAAADMRPSPRRICLARNSESLPDSGHAGAGTHLDRGDARTDRDSYRGDWCAIAAGGVARRRHQQWFIGGSNLWR